MRPQALIGLIAWTCLTMADASAEAVTFEVSFTNTNYQVSAAPGDPNSDTFADLLVQHHLGTPISSTSVTGIENIATSVYAGGISGDYSVLMTTTLDVDVAGDYTFQVGADWGRGGGAALIDTVSNTILQETVTEDDIWWGYNWNHTDVISTTYTLTEGLYTMAWVGFEGCCAGSSTVRFSFNGAPFGALNMTNLTPYVVPIPAPVFLFASSVVALFGINKCNRARTQEGLAAA